MKIGLIDVDSSRYPNLALMKISAYHKAHGDNVEFYNAFTDTYDIVYKSKVFNFTPDFTEVINARQVISGGTGYEISNVDGKECFHSTGNLPDEIEHCYPDYALYGITDTAYGFLTRGCPRQCAFCHVAAKEGTVSHKVADLAEFWRGQKNIVLMDPNILACPQREELLQSLIDSGACVDFNQGLDIRLMTPELASLISRIKIKEIHFAWDRYSDGKIILPKLAMFAEHSPKKHSHNAIVFVLCNFDTTLEQDLERIYTLREIGYWAYVMLYDKQHCAPIYRDLQRWCNNRFIFGSCPRFEDYGKRAVANPDQLTIF